MGDAGLEHPTLTAPKTPISQTPRAESGAPNSQKSSPDPDLVQLVKVWPEHIKAAIKALIQTHQQTEKVSGKKEA
jgi:hypothetical protein